MGSTIVHIIDHVHRSPSHGETSQIVQIHIFSKVLQVSSLRRNQLMFSIRELSLGFERHQVIAGCLPCHKSAGMWLSGLKGRFRRILDGLASEVGLESGFGAFFRL